MGESHWQVWKVPGLIMPTYDAVLSLHDVMPETLPQVEKILNYARGLNISPMPLLVVPGKEWQPGQIARLRKLAEAGHELAAHGWSHQAQRNKGVYHRLYAAVISRNVGEHLDLDSSAIRYLMECSHAWFVEHCLPAPSLYVPPAWALGSVSIKALQGLPFTHIETLRGILDLQSGRLHRLPVIGFEANSSFRAFVLGGCNSLQLTWCHLISRPVRIALHPNDFHLRLAIPLQEILQSSLRCMTYSDVVERGH